MWQFRILETGFFHADGGAMFGAIPKRAWQRKYSSDENNCCILAMNCILLHNKDRVILLDTGVGSKNLGKLSYYGFYNHRDIRELVREEGFKPEEVTDVILSHLHFDHCGGCTYTHKKGIEDDEDDSIKISFPNALHHVSRKQWENYLDPNMLEKGSFRKEDMLPVKEAGLLHLIEEGNTELYKGLTIDIYNGHTEGQLVTSFISGRGVVIFPGDVIPTKAHLSNEWISAYDICAFDSFSSKIKIKQKLNNQETGIVFYHDAYNKFLNYKLKI